MFGEYYDSKCVFFEKDNEKNEPFKAVAFLGDSLTDCYDLAYWYPDMVAVNRGIGGDTAKGLFARLKVSAYDLKPQAIVMLIGINDLERMFDDYESILRGFKDELPKTNVVPVSLTPTGGAFRDRNSVSVKHNERINEYAEKYGYAFVDAYSPLYNEKPGELDENFTEDGLHFNMAGYEVLTKAIRPVLDTLLE